MTTAPASAPALAPPFSLDDLSRLVAQARTTEESQLSKLMETQFGRVLDQVGSLDRTMREGFSKIDKVIDDHEKRLRDQHDMDSKQSGEIGALRENYAKLQGDLKAMEARLDGEIKAVKTEIQARTARELGFWEKLGIEAVKMALFGGFAGGVVVAAMRALGLL